MSAIPSTQTVLNDLDDLITDLEQTSPRASRATARIKKGYELQLRAIDHQRTASVAYDSRGSAVYGADPRSVDPTTLMPIRDRLAALQIRASGMALLRKISQLKDTENKLDEAVDTEWLACQIAELKEMREKLDQSQQDGGFESEKAVEGVGENVERCLEWLKSRGKRAKLRAANVALEAVTGEIDVMAKSVGLVQEVVLGEGITKWLWRGMRY
jgi:hypothetical protein